MREFTAAEFDARTVVANKTQTVSVCLPARECAATVGGIVGVLVELRERGALDEVVVVDAASADGTARIAAAAGATVHQESDLIADAGPVKGKGDAMWRALSVLSGDVLCFLDADTGNFGAHFALGLVGPLLADPQLQFAKAHYRRSLGADPVGGGRVNHLMARPALRVFFPQLAEVRQPLAGEVAARRSLLERIPFATGYGVETAMLIDVWRQVGLDAMCQVDLGAMENAHQSLQALTPMAEAVLRVVAARAGVPGVEGPPERPALRPGCGRPGPGRRPPGPSPSRT